MLCVGVILTHGNMVSSIRSILPLLDPLPSDVYIAYLPLAHVLELIGKLFLDLFIMMTNNSKWFKATEFHELKKTKFFAASLSRINNYKLHFFAAASSL